MITSSPHTIIDNDYYITFLFGTNNIPVNVQKNTIADISIIPMTKNPANYPFIEPSVDASLVQIRYDGEKVILLDFNVVATPSVTDATDLYNAVSTILNNIPSAGVFAQYGSFEDTDLVDGITTFVLTISHGLGSENVMVNLRNASNEIETGYTPVVIDSNTVEIDFGASIGVGTWYWFVTAKS